MRLNEIKTIVFLSDEFLQKEAQSEPLIIVQKPTVLLILLTVLSLWTMFVSWRLSSMFLAGTV